MKKDKKENEKDTHFYSILAILAIVIIHRLYMATGLTFFEISFDYSGGVRNLLVTLYC